MTKSAKQFHLFNDAEAAVQAICSLATRVICRKPVASSSLARFKASAANTRKGLPAKASLEEIFQLAVAENVPVVLWSGLMNRKWAKKFKEAGIKIIFRAVTPTAENTREAIEAGVDVIIATGFDEGGTVPAKVIGTFAILPLIVDAADGKVPVVTAGGLVDKRTVRAAFDLGAEGVYAGILFLATEESPLAKNIKQDMLKYDADDLLMFRAPNSFYVGLPEKRGSSWPGRAGISQ